MFERFTDRARKVMALSHKEALRLRHDYIGSEHILLGLIQEGSGVAAEVLKNLGVQIQKIQSEIERIVEPRPLVVTAFSFPFTPRAKKVLELSMDEAKELGHEHIGTEHLLLGLLCENDGVGAQVLMDHGVRLDDARSEVIRLLGDSRRSEPLAEKRYYRCHVTGCKSAAKFEVIHYDFCPEDGLCVFEQDPTCPFICEEHAAENEKRAQGERRPRGRVNYPYTNKDSRTGFTIYRPAGD